MNNDAEVRNPTSGRRRSRDSGRESVKQEAWVEHRSKPIPDDGWDPSANEGSLFWKNRITKEKVYVKPRELCSAVEITEAQIQDNDMKGLFRCMELRIKQKIGVHGTLGPKSNPIDGLKRNTESLERSGSPSIRRREKSYDENDLDSAFDFFYPKFKSQENLSNHKNCASAHTMLQGLSINSSNKPLAAGSGLSKLGAKSKLMAKTISSMDLVQVGRQTDAENRSDLSAILPLVAVATESRPVGELLRSSDENRDRVDRDRDNDRSGMGTGRSSPSRNDNNDDNGVKQKEKILRRNNSTGKLYINATMMKQDDDLTIRCVCSVIKGHIVQSTLQKMTPVRDFDDLYDDQAYLMEWRQKESAAEKESENESKHQESKGSERDRTQRSRAVSDDWIVGSPSGNSQFDFSSQGSPGSAAQSQSQMNSGGEFDELKIPALDTIVNFFTLVYRTSQLESECIIIALIYCERLVHETYGKFFIRHDNWRSTIFIALVMASKIWDDYSMWNGDFAMILPRYDLVRINKLEILVLETLQFGMKVPPAQYAKYYFILRSLINQLELTAPIKTKLPALLDLAAAKDLNILNPKARRSSSSLAALADGLSQSGGDIYASPLPVQVSQQSGQTSGPGAFSTGGKGIPQAKSTGNLAALLSEHLIDVAPGSAMGSHRRARKLGREAIDLDQLLSGTKHTDADGQEHRSKTNTSNTNTSVSSASSESGSTSPTPIPPEIDSSPRNWNHK